MAKKSKLPADINKRAKSIVDLATGGTLEETPIDEVQDGQPKKTNNYLKSFQLKFQPVFFTIFHLKI
jgi:hypothetical protein